VLRIWSGVASVSAVSVRQLHACGVTSVSAVSIRRLHALPRASGAWEQRNFITRRGCSVHPTASFISRARVLRVSVDTLSASEI
jgi:hypothetical protein